METKKVITRGEQETEQVGFELARELRCGDVVFLYGPLGAGKTTLIRGMAKAFGFDDVFSPSFVIINIYPTEPPFYHIDLYRIKNENELRQLGIDEILSEDCIAVVEWAEKISHLYTGTRIEVYIEPIGEFEREITIRWVGQGR